MYGYFGNVVVIGFGTIDLDYDFIIYSFNLFSFDLGNGLSSSECSLTIWAVPIVTSFLEVVLQLLSWFLLYFNSKAVSNAVIEWSVIF